MHYAKQWLLLVLVILCGCERILFGDLDDYTSPLELEGATGKPCLEATDCPDPDNECLLRTCSSGRCDRLRVAEGTPLQTQTFGDCKKNICDGKGASIQKNDDTDMPDDGQACTSDVCAGGKPFHQPKAAGTLCGKNENNEPLVCNIQGQCVGCITAMDCPGTDDECSQRTCDAAGVCGVSFTAQGTIVAAQTENDCRLHVCDGLGHFVDIPDDTDVPLDDGNVCTKEACSLGMPDHPNVVDGSPCEDGDLCTLMDTCQMGACLAGLPIVCSAQDQCHVAGACDPLTGLCSNPNAKDGTICDDGDACSLVDSCESGVCTGKNLVVCTALDACHLVGTCDPLTGVCSNPLAVDGTACQDGNACTQTDTCQAGGCIGTNPVACMASDQCHLAGTCDPLSGLCSNPAVTDGTMCSSNNAAGACSMGTCIACGDGLVNGTESCDDGNQSTNDGCTPSCGVEIGFACSGTPSVCCSTTCQNNLECGLGEVTVIVSSNPSLPIPDNPTGAIASISVSQMGLVRKIIPVINITHGNTGHLDIFLVSPYGVQRELTTDNGNGANFTATNFSDSAGAAILLGSAPYSGTFGPEQSISNAAGLANQAAAGQWVLRISDDTAGIAGVLNSWSIGVCIEPNVASLCGNGFVEANEQCDDGNSTSGDGCTNCQLEITCGPNQTLVVKRSTHTPQLIPDNNPAGITRAINIGNMGTVAKATAVLNAISHQYVQDLNVSLTSPIGTILYLSSGNGSIGDDYVSTIFDDSAAMSITAVTSTTAPFRGHFRPQSPLSTVVGEAVNGNWTLKISDGATSDVGMFSSWTIALCIAP